MSMYLHLKPKDNIKVDVTKYKVEVFTFKYTEFIKLVYKVYD